MLSAGSSHAPLDPSTTVLGHYILWEIKRAIKIRQEKQHFNFFSFCLFLDRTFSETVARKAIFELTGNYLIRYLTANYMKQSACFIYLEM